jgi:hypothetical protein
MASCTGSRDQEQTLRLGQRLEARGVNNGILTVDSFKI